MLQKQEVRVSVSVCPCTCSEVPDTQMWTLRYFLGCQSHLHVLDTVSDWVNALNTTLPMSLGGCWRKQHDYRSDPECDL